MMKLQPSFDINHTLSIVAAKSGYFGAASSSSESSHGDEDETRDAAPEDEHDEQRDEASYDRGREGAVENREEHEEKGSGETNGSTLERQASMSSNSSSQVTKFKLFRKRVKRMFKGTKGKPPTDPNLLLLTSYSAVDPLEEGISSSVMASSLMGDETDNSQVAVQGTPSDHEAKIEDLPKRKFPPFKRQPSPRNLSSPEPSPRNRLRLRSPRSQRSGRSPRSPRSPRSQRSFQSNNTGGKKEETSAIASDKYMNPVDKISRNATIETVGSSSDPKDPPQEIMRTESHKFVMSKVSNRNYVINDADSIESIEPKREAHASKCRFFTCDALCAPMPDWEDDLSIYDEFSVASEKSEPSEEKSEVSTEKSETSVTDALETIKRHAARLGMSEQDLIRTIRSAERGVSPFSEIQIRRNSSRDLRETVSSYDDVSRGYA